MTNKNNTVLYIGSTDNIYRRILQHRSRTKENFTARYHITKVVYLQKFATLLEARAEEKKLKGWKRVRKNALINSSNPEWNELVVT
jgi:putative endonuclease